MIKQGQRLQHTIIRPAQIEGIGFLTGADVRLRFKPAPPDTGIVFVRVDLDPIVEIPARLERVVSTQRRTVLGTGKAQIGLVEHVLAALAGLRIDNCYVELNAPEPPGLDGSSRDFTTLLRRAGLRLQPATRPIWTVEEPVQVSQGGATITLHPAETGLTLSYLTDYSDWTPVGKQRFTVQLTPGTFLSELSASRTFIFEEEVAELRRQGLGARTTPADLLVFGKRGPIDNQVRWADEPARHKSLDIVGDLALFGQDLVGHLVAFRSGHALNVELVRELARRCAPPCQAPLRRAA
ncbi:MAG: UDP-3-O-acyl-N-acetylglucosamine deacetylase [Gemmataceae bacterium]